MSTIVDIINGMNRENYMEIVYLARAREKEKVNARILALLKQIRGSAVGECFSLQTGLRGPVREEEKIVDKLLADV